MQKLDSNDLLAHQQWLINNGLVTDLHKDNLFMYGSLIHKDVEAVEVDVIVEKKTINYTVYLPSKVIRLVSRYNSLIGKNDIISLWMLKRLLKKQGDLNFVGVLNQFVKDYCGRVWVANLHLRDVKDYKEEVDGNREDRGID